MMAIVALTIVGYILFNSLVQTKADLKVANATVTSYVAKIQQNEAIRKSFELSHRNLTILYTNQETQNKKDKAREHLAIAKPTLIERLANRKFKKNQRHLACITGNVDKCD